MTEQPKMPQNYKVYGRKGKDGVWDFLETITQKKPSTGTVSMTTDLTGKGYTALRIVPEVTAEEPLTDYNSVVAYLRMTYFANSPVFRKLFDTYM